jgi:23S rRNA (cytidine1920-2'-O)/16S rRNA (cytidine1409-2'-O)-methyltransferase
MVVADLSFISLRLLVPVFTSELVRGGSCLLLLVKPQFEAGKKIVSQGKGIVKDARVHEEVLVQVAGEYVASGARVCNMMPSPIRGAKGNVEYFIYHRIGPDGTTDNMPDRSGGLPLREYASRAVAEAMDRWST